MTLCKIFLFGLFFFFPFSFSFSFSLDFGSFGFGYVVVFVLSVSRCDEPCCLVSQNEKRVREMERKREKCQKGRERKKNK